jgi:hypothetical protein
MVTEAEKMQQLLELGPFKAYVPSAASLNGRWERARDWLAPLVDNTNNDSARNSDNNSVIDGTGDGTNDVNDLTEEEIIVKFADQLNEPDESYTLEHDVIDYMSL